MTTIIETLNKQTLLLLKNKKQRLSFLEKNIKLVSPDSILARGYSITSDKNGKMIKTAHQLLPGDEIITRFSDGSISSIIKK
jgi:exodeoxyribonuclease VII large subunit